MTRSGDAIAPLSAVWIAVFFAACCSGVSLGSLYAAETAS